MEASRGTCFIITRKIKHYRWWKGLCIHPRGPRGLSSKTVQLLGKNQCFGTNDHLIQWNCMRIKNLILNFAAEAAIPHFRGYLWAPMSILWKMIKTQGICTSRLSSRTKKWAWNLHNPNISGPSLGDPKLHSKNSVLHGFDLVLAR